jgi:hypothetical protein
MTIKAIETNYKGYRFRSRLEARWAVLFDSCGFAWEYEPEGFELDKLGRYLPDFRVWESGSIGLGTPQWIEVKGIHPTRREIDLITELFWVTRTGAAIVYGEIECRRVDMTPSGPWAVPACVALYGAVGWPMARPYEIEGYDHDWAREDRPWPQTRWLPDGSFRGASLDNCCRLIFPHFDPSKRRLSEFSPSGSVPTRLDVPAAVRAARSARFEFGESGAPAVARPWPPHGEAIDFSKIPLNPLTA